MSFTFGFYNGEGHDRKYDATQVSQMFDGLITDGVFATYGDHLIVEATDEPNTILVRSGRAWFYHTWNYNDANMLIQCPEAEVVLDRWDAIVLDIKPAEMDRVNDIICITGTPSSNPVKPVMADEDVHHQIPLCYIYRHAGSSTITQADIENTIGTSECPFVTGIIETINTDELILQWRGQWDNWMTSTDSYMRTWIANEQTYFTNWLEDQQDYITGWESDRAAEFQEWFDNLQYILDGDVAAHLQNEIDAINAHGLSGSIFEITALDDELIGKTVTVTCGSETASAVFNSEKKAQITGFTAIGAVTIRATDGVSVAATTINVPYFGKYSVEIAFWLATVNIIITDPAFFGEVIIVYKDGITQGTAVFDNTGHATFNANEPGTYTFSSTHAGQTVTNDLTITEEGVYNLNLSSTSNLSYTDWLLAAGLSAQGFSSLDDVLNDEPTVRILMTKHAAVDYVISKNNDTDSLTKIFSSCYAAKWINLRDYALDRFEADSVISDIMDDVGKYGYGELVEVGLVPKMTSNTTPSGEVSASSSLSPNEPWYAFRGTIADDVGWMGQPSQSSYWLKYEFNNPIACNKLEIVNKEANRRIISFDLVASNDNSNWTRLGTFTMPSTMNLSIKTFTFNNNTMYKYYMLNNFVCEKSFGPIVNYLQLYSSSDIRGYGPKGNVPVMTSNTAPYGNCIGTEPRSDMPMWHAFDNNQNTFYFSNTGTAQVGYKFNNPIKIKRAYLYCPSNPTFGNTWPTSFNIQGSNDGNTWVTLYSVSNFTGGESSFDINNDAYYLQYRLYVTEYNVGTTVCIHSLQFYGRELKNVNNAGSSVSYDKAHGSNLSDAFNAVFVAQTGSAGQGAYCKIVNDNNKILPKLVSVYVNPSNLNPFDVPNTKIQGSNDGNNWTDIVNETIGSGAHLYNIDDHEHTYSMFRLYLPNVSNRSTESYNSYTVAIYGMDYSEHSERHWIYDHGVEIESVSLTGSSSKTSDQLECSGTGSKIQTSSAINLASFSLLRMVLGNKYIAAANAEAFGVLDTQSSWPTYSAYARLDSQDKPNNLFLDISNVNESKFIGFGPNNASGQISVTEWWLE